MRTADRTNLAGHATAARIILALETTFTAKLSPPSTQRNTGGRNENADMIAKMVQPLVTLRRLVQPLVSLGPAFAKQLLVVGPKFDDAYYLASNPDVVRLNPLVHFLIYGWREDRDPSPDFSIADYTLANPDVAAAGVNPFYHYLTVGRREGRRLEPSAEDAHWQKRFRHAIASEHLGECSLSRPLDAESGLRIELRCPTFRVQDGYGNAARHIATNLERINVKVSIGGLPHPSLWNGGSQANGANQGDAMVLFWVPWTWRRTKWGKTIGFTMFESTMIPDQWLEGPAEHGFSHVDEVWVPSDWCAEIFRKYASDPKVIPLGVDASAFPARRRRRGEKLRFIHDATKGGDYRKGQQLAIDAFQAAFPGRPDVELVIRCTYELNAASLELRNDSRVALQIGKMSTEQLNRLYGEFDAMLYPSRSEGFGLIPLQAMATGMPCIFPRSSGMLSYANYGLPVDARPVPAWVGRGCFAAPDWTFRQPNEWYEPDFDQLVERLRQIDTEYDSVQDRAMVDAAQIATNWTWDRTARAIVARIEA